MLLKTKGKRLPKRHIDNERVSMPFIWKCSIQPQNIIIQKEGAATHDKKE